MDNLDEIRERIDALAAQMAGLFEQRMEQCRRVLAFKLAHGLDICDPAREEEVVRRGAERIADPDIRAYYVRFQQEVMSLSRDWPRRLAAAPDSPDGPTPACL